MDEDAASTLRLPSGSTASSTTASRSSSSSVVATVPVGPGDPTADGSSDGPVVGRGRTVVADRVLERLAARIALDVPGVVRHSSGPPLSGLGTDLLEASAETAGERVRLRLRLAVRWEVPAHEVAAQVREQVRERLGATTGKSIDRVDVVVGALLPSSRVPQDEGRRVR